MHLKEKNYNKWFYSKSIRKMINYRIEDIDIEKNTNSIFEFVKSQLQYNSVIIELSVNPHDDIGDIERYQNLETICDKNNNQFNYIYNIDYRQQLLLLSLDIIDFNIDIFKEFTNLYGGVRVFLNLNSDNYDELLGLYKSNGRQPNMKKYDYIVITSEDDILASINDISKYPNFKNDIEKLVVDCNL